MRLFNILKTPGGVAVVSPTRRSRRARVAILACAALTGALVPVIAVANLSGSTFESTDGNLVVTNAGNLDWENAPNRVDGVDVPSGGGDNSFGKGTKEDDLTPTVVDGSIPPNKSDLTRFYVANNKGSNDHQFLYLAWERTDTLGSANMDFEINKLAQPDLTTLGTKDVEPTRSEGDLLVRYDFSNGGTVPTLSLVKWLTVNGGASASDCNANNALPCWGAKSADDALDGTNDNQVDLSDAGFADGSINLGTVTDPIPNPDVTLPEATFGEAAIDLTAAGVFSPGVCTNFGSAYLKSRSSSAFTAETKDFIAPETISINNCGNLVVRKISVGGTGTFKFNSTTLADQTPSDNTSRFELTTATAGTAVSTGTIYHGILAGTYDVSEIVPTGWTLTSATCDDGSLVNSISVSVGETVTCTFTDTARATLIVAKETLPDGSAQSFTFTRTSGFGPADGGTFPLSDGQNTGTDYANVLPGTYVVTETVPTTGWKSPPAIVCTGDSGTSNLSSGSGAAATFDLQAGETVTCTFTNTELAKVTITKTDDDDPANAVDGAVFGVYEDVAPASTGSAPGVEDFDPATPNSPAPVGSCTIASGTCSTANVLDPSKAYWVVETTTPSGYTTAAPQRITPTAGQNVPLTFVDKREFKVITIVCQNSNDSLYPSTVKLNKLPSGEDTDTSLSAAQLAAFNTAKGTSITAAQLCQLTGAKFSPRHYGSYNGNVTIPQ